MSRSRWVPLLVGLLWLLAPAAVTQAATAPGGLPLPLPRVQVGVDAATSPREVATSLQILVILTVLSLAPALLVLTTSFTRIVVVLGFVRSALGTQQAPPNQVLVGLALFLTFFVMAPVWNQVNAQALQPYLAGQLDQATALARAEVPLRDFMLRQTREKDLALFVNAAALPQPEKPADLPMQVVVPAFAISELKTAFQLGFVIYIPFIVIDMVVATTLMSMGMMMLPPMMISLPFKILLFVMVDGWHLVVQSLLASFR